MAVNNYAEFDALYDQALSSSQQDIGTLDSIAADANTHITSLKAAAADALSQVKGWEDRRDAAIALRDKLRT